MSSYLLYGDGYFDETDDRRQRLSRPLRTRSDPLLELSDAEFRLHYRMTKTAFVKLLDLLEVNLERPTARNAALSAAHQLACTLHILGHNTMQSDEARIMGRSQPTVHLVFNRVLNELCKLSNSQVKWPDADEMLETKAYFYTKYGLDDVVGVINGTHVRIMAPSQNEADYVNRKGYHSVNVGAICGHELKFIWMSTRFPGNAHDSRVFKTSSLYRDFKNGTKSGVLLGDSAYAAENFLSRPNLNPKTPQGIRRN